MSDKLTGSSISVWIRCSTGPARKSGVLSRLSEASSDVESLSCPDSSVCDSMCSETLKVREPATVLVCSSFSGLGAELGAGLSSEAGESSKRRLLVAFHQQEQSSVLAWCWAIVFPSLLPFSG